MQCNPLASRAAPRGAVSGPRPRPASRGVRLAPVAASLGPVEGPISLGVGSDGKLGAAGGTTRRNTLQQAGLLAAGLAACPCCTGEALASGNAKFDYGTLSGPINWGGTCAAGARQSPIDIPAKAVLATAKRLVGQGPACRPAVLDPRGYKPVKPRILNTGVGTMQANFDKGAQIMMCGGAELELLQFHFHTPSEHAFDGERTAMEVHLVHKNTTTGGLAVIGILMETNGPPNPTLTSILKYAPSKAREEAPSPQLINPAGFLPRGAMQYVRYAGSLTTPGCSEGVDWYVMLDTISVSPEQVLAFAQYVSGGRSFAQNSRPLQPLNGRAFDMQYDCNYT